jgi:hypothetical protein
MPNLNQRAVPIEKGCLAGALGSIRHRVEGARKGLLGLRPFHNDKDPLLVVLPGKNLWYFLGVYSEKGSVFTFT